MTKDNIEDLRTKLIQGINLSYERLLAATKIKDDGELVISRNGKIVKVKASELIDKKEIIKYE